jgi:hypothetical protein
MKHKCKADSDRAMFNSDSNPSCAPDAAAAAPVYKQREAWNSHTTHNATEVAGACSNCTSQYYSSFLQYLPHTWVSQPRQPKAVDGARA